MPPCRIAPCQPPPGDQCVRSLRASLIGRQLLLRHAVVLPSAAFSWARGTLIEASERSVTVRDLATPVSAEKASIAGPAQCRTTVAGQLQRLRKLSLDKLLRSDLRIRRTFCVIPISIFSAGSHPQFCNQTLDRHRRRHRVISGFRRL